MSGLQVTIATSYIFNMLRVEWGKNGWSIDKLKYLTLALDCVPDLDELENYYIKHNKWISIVFGFWKRRLYKLRRFTKNN